MVTHAPDDPLRLEATTWLEVGRRTRQRLSLPPRSVSLRWLPGPGDRGRLQAGLEIRLRHRGPTPGPRKLSKGNRNYVRDR